MIFWKIRIIFAIHFHGIPDSEGAKVNLDAQVQDHLLINGVVPLLWGVSGGSRGDWTHGWIFTICQVPGTPLILSCGSSRHNDLRVNAVFKRMWTAPLHVASHEKRQSGRRCSLSAASSDTLSFPLQSESSGSWGESEYYWSHLRSRYHNWILVRDNRAHKVTFLSWGDWIWFSKHNGHSQANTEKLLWAGWLLLLDNWISLVSLGQQFLGLVITNR